MGDSLIKVWSRCYLWLRARQAAAVESIKCDSPDGSGSITQVGGQGEGKGSAAILVVRSLHGSSVAFDNRPADGKPHAQTVGFGGVKWLE